MMAGTSYSELIVQASYLAASALFILVNGRVLGISGIVGGLLRPRAGDAGWRIAFIAGMLAAPAVWALFMAPVVPRIEAGPAVLVVAGLLAAALGLGLHQRPRRVRPVADVAALAGGHAGLHGHRLCHGLRHAPPAGLSPSFNGDFHDASTH